MPRSVSYAPEAYRVALPALIRFVGKILYLGDLTYIAAAIDFFTAFFALYLLYLTIVNSLPENARTRKERTLAILAFLAILQFPLAWVVPSQRPETLPSALYLALSIFSLAKIDTNNLWIAILFIATLCQGFVRADVPFVFGIAVVVTGIWSGLTARLPFRRLLIISGGLIVVTSGGTQAYLQFVRFPGLNYPPNVPIIQLGSNFVLHRLEIFTIALLPFLLFFVFLIVKRPRLNVIEVIVMLASLLYLPLWFTFGYVSEVRIYVPFLLALSAVVARVIATFLGVTIRTAS